MEYRISPLEAHSLVKSGQASLIDVRDYDEFAASRAEGAKCIPLLDLESASERLRFEPRAILLICQSGERSPMGAELLRAHGHKSVYSVAGGMTAWKAAGLPTLRQGGGMTLESQVRLVAGLLVFLFSALGFKVAPAFHYGAAFIGLMLVLTASFGICPMMSALRRMPWNRVAARPSR